MNVLKFGVIVLSLFGFSVTSLSSQELDMKVKVIVQADIVSDPIIFTMLERSVNDLLNTTKWTDDRYEAIEKIKGSVQITIISELAQGSFAAEMVIQTERPVYKSTYKSPMLLMIDKAVNFSWNGQLPLVVMKNVFSDNLSAILSYYANIIIGVNRDSFSPMGGDNNFKICQEILTSLSANVTKDEGWRNDGSTKRNRFWLVDNLMHPRLRPYRQAFYEYHRVCLDNMYDDAEKSRAIMLSSLTSMGQAEVEFPNSMLIQVFGDSKKDEVIEIFKAADRGSKNKVKTIMVGMDASKKERYNALN